MKQKINIMKAGPHVTEQEINRFMDFDALLKLKEQTLKRSRRLNRLRNVFVGIIILMVIPGVLIVQEISEREELDAVDRKRNSTSAVTTIDSVESMNSRARTNAPAPRHTGDTTIAESAESHQTQVDVNKTQKNTPPAKDEQVHAPSGYIQPEPVDGYEALYAYFDRELQYPMIAAKDSVEGVVTVDFVIGADAKVKKVTIENSLGDSFDQEVLRLFKYMPPWRPATYDGKPVDSKVSLPITFSLKKHTNP